MDLPPTALLAGLATVDLVHVVRRFPAPDEKVRAESQELAAGGPAANAAVAYAALGGRARLLTALGSSALAAVAHEDLRTHGVEVVDLAAGSPEPPPVAACAVDEHGARTVVSVGAAASAVTLASVDLEDASVVLLDGHHPLVALEVARAARASGVPVVLDAGSWKPVLADLLPLVDVAVCSAGFRVPGSSGDLEDVLAAGASSVAVTAGGGPVRWHDGRSAGEVPVAAVPVVDTLGAGDAFHGAFAWATATRPGRALPERLGFAAAVAGVRVGVAGARAWLADPSLARAVEEWLR
ncbi:sugar/nucleoside kinase (ribokinase family) [Motilibacter rhizosphaerae]|uniref:Sugar/nucleoside kinase (Ribokinase family) n=1 Tax=Motilibacter rhizosphaerae TaxID=598652 RepID=A0A4Q7NVE1_9ACTN|nr:PfkB family carbohydrate kinase [Motilibacter rhizosphaerae]RZS90930.1 sugar/nucleoside kinase (ribokinase family) [Motilibacter rhizosphaerae]